MDLVSGEKGDSASVSSAHICGLHHPQEGRRWGPSPREAGGKAPPSLEEMSLDLD